jgi:arsenite/tail-anchored protein-transporting ATPase
VLNDLQGKHRYLSESLRGRYVPDATDAVISGIEEQVEEIRGELRERSAFHWVLLPEELALREAQGGIGGLRKLGVQVAEVVVNRVLPPPPGACALCRGRRAAEARVVARAKRVFEDIPLRIVPATDDEPRGLASLRRLGRARPPRPAMIRGHQAKFRISPGVPETFVEAVAEPRLVLFGGKGGVGKTTCAAAFALERAAEGARVLLLSTDPAHSLGDAFDEAIGDPGREVAPGLHARELDADRAFARERDRYREAVDDLFDALRGEASFDATFDRVVVQDLIDLAPPGLDELFALGVLVDELPRFDCVVVDTAPTGHALRLLELPDKALGWVHAILEILLKYRRVVGLGDLARTLTGTARDLRHLGDLLRDPARCRFVPVTRAAELPRIETERLLRALRRLKVSKGPLLVNARTPPGCARCRKAAAREEAHLTRLRRVSPAMLEAPLLPVPPRGAAALRRFAGSWTRA